MAEDQDACAGCADCAGRAGRAGCTGRAGCAGRAGVRGRGAAGGTGRAGRPKPPRAGMVVAVLAAAQELAGGRRTPAGLGATPGDGSCLQVFVFADCFWVGLKLELS